MISQVITTSFFVLGIMAQEPTSFTFTPSSLTADFGSVSLIKGSVDLENNRWDLFQAGSDKNLELALRAQIYAGTNCDINNINVKFNVDAVSEEADAAIVISAGSEFISLIFDGDHAIWVADSLPGLGLGIYPACGSNTLGTIPDYENDANYIFSGYNGDYNAFHAWRDYLAGGNRDNWSVFNENKIPGKDQTYFSVGFTNNPETNTLTIRFETNDGLYKSECEMNKAFSFEDGNDVNVYFTPDFQDEQWYVNSIEVTTDCSAATSPSPTPSPTPSGPKCMVNLHKGAVYAGDPNYFGTFDVGTYVYGSDTFENDVVNNAWTRALDDNICKVEFYGDGECTQLMNSWTFGSDRGRIGSVGSQNTLSCIKVSLVEEKCMVNLHKGQVYAGDPNYFGTFDVGTYVYGSNTFENDVVNNAWSRALDGYKCKVEFYGDGECTQLMKSWTFGSDRGRIGSVGSQNTLSCIKVSLVEEKCKVNLHKGQVYAGDPNYFGSFDVGTYVYGSNTFENDVINNAWSRALDDNICKVEFYSDGYCTQLMNSWIFGSDNGKSGSVGGYNQLSCIIVSLVEPTPTPDMSNKNIRRIRRLLYNQ